MNTHMTLEDFLQDWAKTDEDNAVAQTISILAEVGTLISKRVSQGSLAGSMGKLIGHHDDGDTQKELDLLTNDMCMDALNKAPVAYIASEELDDAIATSNNSAPLCVAIDPLDGSSNIDTNVSIGTIFSILPCLVDDQDHPRDHFFQKGVNQLAAGYIIYGPNTAMVLTVGTGVHIFTLDPADDVYKRTSADMQVATSTKEFAINASNYRHWSDGVRQYIDDCIEGIEGPRGKNFNTRWIGSMVAECHRILMRGGIYIYTGDVRDGYRDGRLRLIYEGNPIAFLMEQSGGAASNGQMRILEVEPTAVHQRVPLIFGSREEVDMLQNYIDTAIPAGSRPPLFGQRGLFRT